MEQALATNSDGKLSGKVVIVTGSTQGLGEGISNHLAKLGADGLVICGRNQDGGERVASALNQSGCPSIYVRADLAIEEDCRQVVQACDTRFGRVNGLVNAAGITTRGTLEDTTVDLWDHLFAVNTRAPFILMQEAVRIMRRENIEGSVVNILSVAVHCGAIPIMAYSASKGALAILTKNVAHALRFDRIRVNGINMGWADTEGEHAIRIAEGEPDNWLDLAEANEPFGRLLRTDDIAKLTAYLLGDDAEMMTGSLIDFNQHVIGALD
ncbi:MAG: SDR family oxidoreductase [Anaerolineales bacterium]|nr:SDR family oxidoreductase [Anaerolineales bacterium]